MPHWWAPIPWNPTSPTEIRDRVKRAVEKNDARLVGDEVFFRPGSKTGYALIDSSDEAIGRIVSEVKARGADRLQTADEAEEASAD